MAPSVAGPGTPLPPDGAGAATAEFDLGEQYRALAVALRPVYLVVAIGGGIVEVGVAVWLDRFGGWARPEYAVGLLLTVGTVFVALGLTVYGIERASRWEKLTIDAQGIWTVRPTGRVTGVAWADPALALEFWQRKYARDGGVGTEPVHLRGIDLPFSLDLPLAARDEAVARSSRAGLRVGTHEETSHGRFGPTDWIVTGITR